MPFYYYGVRDGRKLGVYGSWAACRAQVDGYSHCRSRKFKYFKDAADYVTYDSDVDDDMQDVMDVFTDGCCRKNGKWGARAGVGVWWGEGDLDNISARLRGRQTNNCAEIAAAKCAVKTAIKRGYRCLRINTDSDFLIKSMTQYMDRWLQNGWRTAKGYEVVNRYDFESLLNLTDKLDQVIWNFVEAHSGIEGNEGADQLANHGANQAL